MKIRRLGHPMAAYTVRLGDSADIRRVGGKGANLGALVIGGFPVPEGFVVTVEAYRDFIDAWDLADASADHLREAIPSLRIPDSIAVAVLAAYASLGSPAVAVRSSGTSEDLEGVSFAGQHDTYLGIVGAEAVLEAVRNCWASLWTRRAVAYRDRLSWDERGLALAVVVQRMVEAEWAGVMFTADPVSGRRDRIVLEAVRGLGDPLVSGEVTGQHYVIDNATGAVVAGNSEIPQSALSDLVSLGRAVQKHFGAPQDIEWTYVDGHCELVQTRPLTALPDDESRKASSSKRSAKPLGNFGVTADHMPYPPFPMDVSLLFRPALCWVLDGIRSAGLYAPPLEEVLVEIDDGVVQIVPPRVRPTWRAMWRVPAAMPAIVRLIATKTDSWNLRSEQTLVPLAVRLDTEDLSGLGETALLGLAHDMIGTVGRLMPSRFGALFSGMAAEETSKLLLRLAVGRKRFEALHAGLMSDVPCVLTSANADLERLAAIVRSEPKLREIYRVEEPHDIADRLAGSAPGLALRGEIEAHLRAYGFRAVSIFTIGLSPLRDEPWIVHGYVKSLARLDRKTGRNAAGRLERAREELVSEAGVVARVLRPAITALLASARKGAGFRDDSQYALEMSLAVTRRVLLELGDRLVERRVLAHVDDIAYLELDEVAALHAPTMPGAPLAAQQIVERRKAARAASLDHYTVIPAELFAPSDDACGVNGMPASRGRFVGRVRVVHDETEFATLQDGEVLVCPFTNPTWTPLFSVAGAVVVDSGGAASHAAIVAREVGIPAIMGTGNGTRTLSNGQRVLVDADHGIVVPISS